MAEPLQMTVDVACFAQVGNGALVGPVHTVTRTDPGSTMCSASRQVVLDRLAAHRLGRQVGT
jgi:hypothetical protein